MSYSGKSQKFNYSDTDYMMKLLVNSEAANIVLYDIIDRG
jgi:hypothetical protein